MRKGVHLHPEQTLGHHLDPGRDVPDAAEVVGHPMPQRLHIKGVRHRLQTLHSLHPGQANHPWVHEGKHSPHPRKAVRMQALPATNTWVQARAGWVGLCCQAQKGCKRQLVHARHKMSQIQQEQGQAATLQEQAPRVGQQQQEIQQGLAATLAPVQQALVAWAIPVPQQ